MILCEILLRFSLFKTKKAAHGVSDRGFSILNRRHTESTQPIGRLLTEYQ